MAHIDEHPAVNRWLADDRPKGGAYDERWKRMSAEGRNVHGEADFVETLGPRSVLDAGCGTGRVAIELDRRGIEVVGVDLDPSMLAAARAKAPHVAWVADDLVTVDLGRRFDVVVLAGNVMIFLAPGTEGPAVANLARHVRPGGALVAGFQLPPAGIRPAPTPLDLPAYDELCAAAGLVAAERWSTWDRQPFRGGDYAVSVHRRDHAE
jgi:SAM-dependent methyltransferase